MAYIVKNGLYYLSNVAIHNEIINCVTSSLAENVVKLNGEVVTDDAVFQDILARMRAVPLLAEKVGAKDIEITEVAHGSFPQ